MQFFFPFSILKSLGLLTELREEHDQHIFTYLRLNWFFFGCPFVLAKKACSGWEHVLIALWRLAKTIMALCRNEEISSFLPPLFSSESGLDDKTRLFDLQLLNLENLELSPGKFISKWLNFTLFTVISVRFYWRNLDCKAPENHYFERRGDDFSSL